MSQRSHVVLIVVLLALVAALAAVFVGSDTMESPSSSASAPRAISTGTSEGAPTPADLAHVPSAGDDSEPALRVSDELAGRSSLADAGALAAELSSETEVRWVEGVLAFPAGTPEDDTLRVLSLAEALVDHERYRAESPLATAPEELTPSEASGLWTVAPVDSDGRFRVAFPREASEGWIEVSGRYLALGESLRVDLTERAPLEVAPMLGGWIVGRVSAEGAPTDVGDVPVELGVDELDTMFGQGRGLEQLQELAANFRQRRGHTDAQGHFEFRAVVPSKALRVRARPEALAMGQLGTVEVVAGQRTDVSIALTRGALIAGKVTDEKGAPVAGAEVRAHETRAAFGMSFPGELLRKVDSDEDGRFELVGVRPGNLKVIVVKKGFLDSTGESLEVTEGQELRNVALVLDRGLSIHGTVHLPDGRPATGAELSANRDVTDIVSAGFRAMRAMQGEAVADEQGRFEIDSLGDASYKLQAVWREEGEGPENLEYVHVANKVRPGAEALAIVLDPPMILAGRVVDEDGAPVPAFELSASLRSDVAFLPSADSKEAAFESEDGAFAWTELYAGKWTIEAAAEGFSPSERIELEMPSDAPLDLVLPRAAQIAGRVLDPAGATVAGATVTVELDLADLMASRMGQREFPETETESSGRFTLDIAPGEQSLVASHPDWADSETVSVSVASGGTATDVELVLRRGAVVTGEIYDKEGELASGAQVIVQRPDGRGQRFGQSDNEGFFRFENVTPGNWQLIGMIEGDEPTDLSDDEGFDFTEMMANMRIAMVELADEAEEHVLLGAPPEDPVLVRGQVTSAGEPLPKVMLSFFAADGRGDAMSSLRMTQTNSDGRYEFQLDEPGKYVINVQQLVNMTGQQQTVEFREEVPAEETYELDFQMPGGTIRGRVYSADGSPAASARVSLTAADGITYGSLFGGQYSDIRTDEDGNYELNFLRPGVYSIGAGGVYFGGAFGGDSADGRSVRSGIRVTENQIVTGIDFHLGGSGKISGTVLNDAGKPVAEAAIFLRDEDGDLLELFSMVTTDGSGRFQYLGVAEGNYTVTARTDELVTSRSVGVEVEAGKTADTQLSVVEGTTVLVSLVDKTGAEVEARVHVKDPEGREWNGMMSMAALMEVMQGGFDTAEQRVGPLAPGTYEVSATTADGRSVKKSITLGRTSERKVKLRLRD